MRRGFFELSLPCLFVEPCLIGLAGERCGICDLSRGPLPQRHITVGSPAVHRIEDEDFACAASFRSGYSL
jgi:hypothetical protein